MFSSIDNNRPPSVVRKNFIQQSADALKQQRLKRMLDEIRAIADALPGPMKAGVSKMVDAIEKLADSGNVDAALSSATALLGTLRRAKGQHEYDTAIATADRALSRIEEQAGLDVRTQEEAALSEHNRQEAHRVLGTDRLQLSEAVRAPHPSQLG